MIAPVPAPAARTSGGSLLSGLQPQPPDGLLALIGMYARDPRRDKIDVGIGIYRDADGRTPVFQAVKEAEVRLLEEQATKAYLGPGGDLRFTALLGEIMFGADMAASPRLMGVQTPGGTGALRLGAELLARAAPGRTIWVGTPTWANHGPLLRQARLRVRAHRFFHRRRGDLDFVGMLEDLAETRSGDILLLHACCHNPTGISFDADQWQTLIGLIVARGIVPFVDIAYQGLGHGLESDAEGARALLAAVPEALVAYSCDKNFGLYRDRVGALWAWAPDGRTAALAEANLFSLTRTMWSMPPDHGAAVVRIVLDDADLRRKWAAELDGMSARIRRLRSLLAEYPRLRPISHQAGLFALLPLAPDAVPALRERHGIYMADDGRINIAGLQEAAVPRFIESLAPFLDAAA